MYRRVTVAGMRARPVDLALRAWIALLATSAVLLITSSFAAGAESLREALVSAYEFNPTLDAERARLRATDEEVARARAGFRPDVNATADIGRRRVNTESRIPGSSLGDGGHNPKGYALTLTQPIFHGFRTMNALREAEANVRAGRESLRTIERNTLLNGVVAYMDVVRDQAIVRLRENNVKVLTEQLTATKDRFEVGEVTKTDVAQAEARRAGSISQLNLAQANLKASRAVYEQVIGHPPSNPTDPPSIEHVLPNSLPEALSIADAESPEVLQAVHLEEAARFEIKQIIGETLPQIDLEAQYMQRWEPSVTTRRSEESFVVGRLTVPLYSGGEPSARVRAARDIRDQRQREIDASRAKARADVVAAWSRLVAARAQIESDQAQVRASGIALNGVREEEKVGQRTVLDVLDAEQEYLNAQVTLVGTRRDMVVAAFTLFSAVGRLDALSLGLPVAYYDPTVHYHQVRRKLFGFGHRKGLLR